MCFVSRRVSNNGAVDRFSIRRVLISDSFSAFEARSIAKVSYSSLDSVVVPPVK